MIYNELKQHGTEDFPFELYRVNHQHPKYAMAYHWHTNLELIRVLDGELFLRLDNRNYTLQAGDIAFINSETVHSATPKNCFYECIVFNLQFLKTQNRTCDSFIDSILSHSGFLTEIPQDEHVKHIVNQIFEELNQKVKQ